MTNTKDQSETNFLGSFLRGYDFALDLQEPPNAAVDDGAKPAHIPGARTALRGLDLNAVQDLHNSAKSGNKRSKALMQNIQKGLAQQHDGDSGYQWWKDTRTFRVPEPPDGVFEEAASYIYEEMMRNSRSTALVGMRRLNEPGTFVGEAEGLLRFRRKVKGNGPWDHKRTLRRGGENKGQTQFFQRHHGEMVLLSGFK